jgi:hypothetical protein
MKIIQLFRSKQGTHRDRQANGVLKTKLLYFVGLKAVRITIYVVFTTTITDHAHYKHEGVNAST